MRQVYLISHTNLGLLCGVTVYFLLCVLSDGQAAVKCSELYKSDRVKVSQQLNSTQ